MSGRGKGGKGLGKGGAKRHRKVLRDNIQVRGFGRQCGGRAVPGLFGAACGATCGAMRVFPCAGHHKARHPSFGKTWRCQAYQRAHLRGDAWCAEGGSCQGRSLHSAAAAHPHKHRATALQTYEERQNTDRRKQTSWWAPSPAFAGWGPG